MSNKRQKITISSVSSSPEIKTGSNNSTIKKANVVGGFPNGGGSSFSPSQVMFTSPQFYSPIHTPMNWQIPAKRREIYLWMIDNKGLILKEDLTYEEIGKIDFIPSSIIKDTLTDGVIFENVKTKNILSGHGNWKDPIHISKRSCKKKKFIKIQVSGYYHDLRLSEEHNLFSIDSVKLRNTVKKFGQKLYRQGERGPKPKKKFIQETQWGINKHRADKLKLKDFILTPIPKFKGSKYENLDEDILWAIGLNIADGSTNKDNCFGYTHYNCNIEEQNLIKNIKRILLEKYGDCRDVEHTNSEKCRRISTDNKKAFELFSNFIIGKLVNKKFTKEILHLTKFQMLRVLAGYFDGDGSFDKESHNIIANNHSQDMADQIYFMCLMCGIPCTLNRYPFYGDQPEGFGKRNTEWCYRLFIPSSEIYKLQPYMKSEKIPKDYKYESYDRVVRFFTKDNDGNDYFAQPVEKIEEYSYSGTGYDLQIDPESDYLCSGFKVSNCRFFGSMEPKVVASLRFYSQFPFSGFKNVLSDPIRSEHFDNLRKRLNLDRWLPLIAYEYFAMGDVFPFVSFFCPTCGGSQLLKNGDSCNHEGGTISMLSVLNPDWIDVKMNPIDPSNPTISLIPDDTLKQIVWSKNPPEIFNALPQVMKTLILANKPIPLSKRSITHLKHDEIPYQPYGRSIIASLFPTLAYQDKLKQAQWIVAERHILPIKVVKVGNDQRPAGGGDISDVQNQLAMSANDPNLTLVTHHAFDMQFIGASGKVLQLTKEWELIEKNIIQGLGVNEALLSGSGPSYSQAAIGIEATIRRLDIVRNLIANWIEEKIYKEEARMQCFYKENMRGEKVLDYPTIKWDDLNLRDETQKNQMYVQLWDKGIVSTQFICEQLGIDYEVETERVRLEQQFQQQFGISPQQRGPSSKGGKGPGAPMGGGFGGGGPKLPGGDPNKGNLPGGQSGPGLPGDSIAPSMSGGESAGPMASLNERILTSQVIEPNTVPHSQAYEMAKQFSPMVSRPGKFRIKDKDLLQQMDELKYKHLGNDPVEEEEPEIYEGPRTGLYRPTNIEGMVYSAINSAIEQENLPADFYYQINPEPERMSRITCDGVFPSIRLIIEADGKQFHSSAEDIEKNQRRDDELRSYGWTVVRYTEDQIKFKINEVIKNIIETAQALMTASEQTHPE